MTYRTSRVVSALAMALCFAISFASPASAQTYPSRPVRLVVPFSPGAFTDTFARMLAQKLSVELGQQVIVDNREGAGGNIGAGVVAKADPDGYTLLMGTVASAISASVYKNLSYDLKRDLMPVGLVATVPSALVVSKSLPVQSVSELVQLARSQPGKFDFSSSGYGGLPHLAGEMFKAKTNTDIVHVPFKGISPALTGVIGERVAMMFASVDTILAYQKSGQLKVLAVTSAQRSKILPDVPTMAEAGIPNFEVAAWAGVMAPAKTPTEIIALLNAKINEALRSPDLQNRLQALGAEVVSSTPDEFSRFLAADIKKWQEVARTSSVSIN
jgi:tripartite-type tricarboxylate transporter receptor subunit TctC